MSQLQSVVFNPKQFTTAQARGWMKDHNIQPIKMVDKTKTQFRYRIQNPRKFKRFVTKKVSQGIMLVIGFPS